MLARGLLLRLVADHQAGKQLAMDSAFLAALKAVLEDTSLDKVRQVLGRHQAGD